MTTVKNVGKFWYGIDKKYYHSFKYENFRLRNVNCFTNYKE